MNLQKILLNKIKFILFLMLFFPLLATAAHIITITNTTPFPQPAIATGTTATSVYTVKNNSTNTTITVIDQSQLPTNNGLTILSDTCGQPLPPQQSCVITLQLLAPASPQNISGTLREWAKPSADAVQVPINLAVLFLADIPYTITPSAGTGGTISPSTPQIVFGGGSITFTATANAKFAVLQWLVDGIVVQSGGTTFTLNDVTANHTVQVVFIPTYVITPSVSGTGGTISPNTPQTVNQGSSLTFTATPNAHEVTYQWRLDGTVVQTLGDTYTLNNITADHTVTVSFASQIVTVAAGVDGSTTGLVVVSKDNGNTFTRAGGSAEQANNQYSAASCTGQAQTATCITAGQVPNGPPTPPILTSSIDGGTTWTAASIPGLTSNGIFTAAACTGTAPSVVCTAAGDDTSGSGAALLVVSPDGTNTWSVVSGVPASGVYNATSCTGSGSTSFCIAAGVDNSLPNTASIIQSTDGGHTWTTPSIPGGSESLNGSSCIGGNLCVAVGSTNAGNPSVFISNNTGATWTLPNSLPSTVGFQLSTVSCTGSGSSAICAASGSNTVTHLPAVFVSQDAGNNWSSPPIIGLTVTNGRLVTASCTGSGSTAICALGGEDLALLKAFLVVSTDGGNTWNQTAINTLGGGVSFISGISCNSNAIFTLCTAVGFDTSNTLIAVSTGSTWNKNLTATFANGEYSGAGSAN